MTTLPQAVAENTAPTRTARHQGAGLEPHLQLDKSLSLMLKLGPGIHFPRCPRDFLSPLFLLPGSARDYLINLRLHCSEVERHRRLHRRIVDRRRRHLCDLLLHRDQPPELPGIEAMGKLFASQL
jgi:hypothetical protein